MNDKNLGPFTERDKSKKRGILKLIGAIAAGLALAACLTWVLLGRISDEEPVVPQSPPESQIIVQYEPEPRTEPHAPDESSEPDIPEALYPVGKLSISENRKGYVSGSMLLEIPRLDFAGPVMDGTDQQTLNKGVGLFDYAHLPGLYNSNTSLAGHRDIYGKEFYYIDTITDGDLMYLTYEGTRYTYEYMETYITSDTDWDPIRAREFASITLMSCDPIGTSRDRIIVVGRLIGMEDADYGERGPNDPIQE